MRRPFAAKPAPAPAPTLDQTSQRLEARGNKLDADIASLNAQIGKLMHDSQQPQNRQQSQRLRSQAMTLLKRRKMLEAQQSKVEGQRFNIDRLASQQEDLQIAADVARAMRAANQATRQQAGQVSIDDVDELMLDMEDQQQDIDDISSMLATPTYAVDDAEIEAEFDALMGEDAAVPQYQQQPAYRAPPQPARAAPARQAARPYPR
jgi:charged multivesicular body protein 5